MVETYSITGEPKSDAIFTALEGCQKGDRVIYHVGPHCGGVHRFSALSASDRKLCLLFCKKIGDGLFEYLAVKR